MAASDEAVARALAFLERRQRPAGAFPVVCTTDPRMERDCVEDPSLFPTALIAHALSFCPGAAAMRERAGNFLLGEMDENGLWKHWTREHPQFAWLPPDVDDTSCASAVLAGAGRAPSRNRDILLANRDRHGLFLTWIVPRPRWAGLAHARVTMPQLLRAPALWMFFRQTSAAPGDVDAAVNANALFYLGDVPKRAAVERHLLAVLRDRRESQCDKWYENPFVIWYFFSRALAGSAPEAGLLIGERIAATAPTNALEAALAVCSLNYWRIAPPPALLSRLLDGQLPSGSWPRAAFYHGGRKRRRDGSFEAPHPDTPRWGSEELTTALAVEALTNGSRPG
jgi:hypothetical protein